MSRDLVISDKMNIKINLGTFVAIIIMMISGTAGFYAIKSDFDKSIATIIVKNNTSISERIRIERKFDSSIHELHLVDENIMEEQKQNRESNVEIISRLSGIDTDLKWLINNSK